MATPMLHPQMEPLGHYVANLQISKEQKTDLLALVSRLFIERHETATKTNYSKVEEKTVATPAAPSPDQHDSVFVPNNLPRIPLPDVNALCTAFLSGVKAFASPEELEATMRALEEFQQPGSPARILYDRAAARAVDPDITNWSFEPQLRRGYLDRRASLVPFTSFWFGHPFSQRQHSQSERAAILAFTANNLRFKLEAGLVKPAVLHGQELTNAFYPWLFNATRIPGIDRDRMERFPYTHHCVVFRKGHAFKLGLSVDDRPASLQELYDGFESILNHPLPQSSLVTIFTADDRRPWAEAREELQQVSPENAATIAAIEAAAFTVSLDEAAPTTQAERGRQFHFGGEKDAANRWHDKSLQFLVCKNGFSATLGEHTMLDAFTLNDLNEAITNAVKGDLQLSINSAAPATTAIPFQYLPLTTTASLDAQIDLALPRFTDIIKDAEHKHYLFNGYGSNSLRAQKMSPNSVFQMVVQLAAKSLFGKPIPCFETVNQAQYHHGRFDIIQVVNSQVAAFVESMDDPTKGVPERRNLLLNATRAHVASINKARRNLGWERNLTSLYALLEKDDEVPSLYRDPVYKRVRPRLMISNCFDTGMIEKGCLWREMEAIWLHYEVQENSAFFSVATRKAGRATEFCNHVEEAAKRVGQIVFTE